VQKVDFLNGKKSVTELNVIDSDNSDNSLSDEFFPLKFNLNDENSFSTTLVELIPYTGRFLKKKISIKIIN
jgi:hypothetical protein